MTSVRTVIIYRRELLNWSETFIRSQVHALQNWSGVLVGERLVPGGLPLNEIDVRLLSDTRGRRVIRMASNVLNYFGRPYPNHRKEIRAIGAELIHAHFGMDGTYIWPVAHSLDLPMLVTLHGYDINTNPEWWRSGKAGPSLMDYPRQLLRMAVDPKVHFIAVSEAIRHRAIEYGIPSEKVKVSYIGVDTKRFQPSGLPLMKRRKRILFVGRMVEKKGPLHMIRAYAQVRAHVPDAELVMVGDGPLRANAEKLARDLNLPVTFAAVLSNEQVLERLHEARVFCLPSVTAANGDSEGLPISILEAQACGVPVVTTAHSGNPEGLQVPHGGYVVPERDEDALAQALVSLLTDELFNADAQMACAAFVRERFDIVKNTLLLEDCYEKICSNNPIVDS